MALKILHTNDFHGTLSGPKFERLRELRSQADVYFDSGDAIKAGNLGVALRPEAVWPLLDELRCTASVPGNRETHLLEPAFRAKLAGARHPILCANLFSRSGELVLPASLVFEASGLRVGVLGVMVPMVTRAMKTQAASAFLWTPPIPAAVAIVAELRSQVDCLIALTHVGFRQDQELAAACPSLDLILGGHSHTVIEQPIRVGTTWICQGGSHGRYAGGYEWGEGDLTGRLVSLD